MDIPQCVDLCEEVCTADSEDLERFLSACAENVWFLCLNHCTCKFIPPNGFFSSFNNLTELHIKDCGFPEAFIIQEVPEMKTLQAFSCSLTQGRIRLCCSDRQTLKVSESVRRLNIDINIDNHCLLRDLLYQFSKVTHLHINLYLTSELYSMLDPTDVFPKINFPSLHTCTLSILRANTELSPMSNMYLSFLYTSVLSVMALRDESREWKRLEIWDNPGLTFGERGPPQSRRCICFPCGLVHTTMDLDMLEETISRDAGVNVKYLFLNNISVSQSCVIAFHGLLGVLTSLCENLSEINLAGTHNTFPERRSGWLSTVLDTISSVHGLKRLVIPECCVCPVTYRHVQEAHDAAAGRKRMKTDIPKFRNDDNDYQRQPDLLKLVEGCPCLVELDIRNQPKRITTDAPCNCDNPQDGLRDEDLFPILEMHKLENLTLIGLKSVARLEFLKELSVQCPSLKTLRLAGLGPQGMCPYWASLAPALSTMNSLQELSLDHLKLPLNKESFWLELGKIPSLVRLCIISGEFYGNLQPHQILSVPTLKTLHVHSLARNVRNCLAKLSSQLKSRKVDVQIDELHIQGSGGCYENFYECQRMCYKGSTVAILMDTCGLLH